MSEVPLVTPNNTSGRGRANNLISSDIVGGGRTTRRSLILLVMFGLLALLGLLFVARRNMSGALDNSTPLSQGTNHGSGSYSESILNMGNNPAYTEFLVKEDYKGGRLNEAQLKDLVGMYYAKAPQTSELQALYKAGERVNCLLDDFY